MINLAISFLAANPLVIFGIAAAAAAFYFGWRWRVRRGGVLAERARTKKVFDKVKSEGERIDDAIAGRTPAESRERLRDKWTI